LLILTIGLTGCGKPYESEGGLATPDSLIIHSPSAKTKQLVEAILNLPSVIRFSKTDLIQKKYDTISIYFKRGAVDENIFPIFQKGESIRLIRSLDAIKTDERPCYVFTEITVNNDEAYVYMVFDILEP
jgi:hypothetical protein